VDLAASDKSEDKKPRWGKLDDLRSPSDVLGTVKRFKVFFSRPFGEVTLTEFATIECDGAAIVECFSSVGLLGIMTGKHLVKHLKLPLIGILQSEHFPVTCVVQNEQPSYPVRIYGDRRLVVFMAEMGLKVPPESLSSVVESIFDFAHRHRCPMIYSIEGIPRPDSFEVDGQEVRLTIPGANGEDEEGGEAEDEEEASIIIDDTLLAKMELREAEKKSKADPVEAAKVPPSPQKISDSTVKRPTKKAEKGKKEKTAEDDEQKSIDEIADELFGKKIHYVTTSLDMAKSLRKLGHIPLVDGIIPGVTGGLLAQAPLTEQEVTALLAPTSLILPVPEGSIPILRLLQHFLPDSQDLERACKDLEEEGSDLHKILSGLLAQGVAEKKGNVPFGIYG